MWHNKTVLPNICSQIVCPQLKGEMDNYCEPAYPKSWIISWCKKKLRNISNIPEMDAIQNIGYNDAMREVICGLGKESVTHPVPSLPVEPLAVLADRKGYFIARIDGNGEDSHKWDIGMFQFTEEGEEVNWKGFEAPTYEAAELAARAFLSSLKDKEGAK